MAWRVVECEQRQWNVSVAAERRANSQRWSLVLSFRAGDGDKRLLWAEYPMVAASRSSLLQQAERIPDSKLIELLASHLRPS
jgi:hypothetical protein